MNFLGHMYLSGNDPEVLVGNFMGDFVKGRLDPGLPLRIRAGLHLHRRIDSHVEHHPLFTRSRGNLAPAFGRYRGVMVDLFYDHFLAARWEAINNAPLEQFLVRVRESVERARVWLPDRLRPLLPFIFDELIPSYRTIAGIGEALCRMSQRIGHENPLVGGEKELVLHYETLLNDFEHILPQLRDFSRTELPGLLQAHGLRS